MTQKSHSVFNRQNESDGQFFVRWPLRHVQIFMLPCLNKPMWDDSRSRNFSSKFIDFYWKVRKKRKRNSEKKIRGKTRKEPKPDWLWLRVLFDQSSLDFCSAASLNSVTLMIKYLLLLTDFHTSPGIMPWEFAEYQVKIKVDDFSFIFGLSFKFIN